MMYCGGDGTEAVTRCWIEKGNCGCRRYRTVCRGFGDDYEVLRMVKCGPECDLNLTLHKVLSGYWS